MTEMHQPYAARVLHTMLRVGNLERSLAFYIEALGMQLFRREDYPSGRFTLAFIGYGDEETGATIELTHNWDRDSYDRGNGYGHIAVESTDLNAMCSRLSSMDISIVRPPGPMTAISPDRTTPEKIAFVEDPDGYRIELIERQTK